MHHGRSGFCRCSNGHAQSTNGELLRSLHRLARNMSVATETPAPFLRGALASITRRSKLLVAAFDDLALFATARDMSWSASLCLRSTGN